METEKIPLHRRASNKARDIWHNLMAWIFGTKYHEKKWSQRKDSGEYWETKDHPHRDLLMSKLPYYRPNSLLEIGCNTGPNLYRAAKLFPKAKLTGIDINEDAIESGRVFFKQLGMNNVNLIIGKADNLSSFGSKSFDIVLSEALLIYIGKDKIEKVIQEMIRVARRAIIVLEYHDDESTALGDYMFDSSYWKRNYDALFRNQKAVKDVKITRITREMWDDDRWVKFGAIIEARLANEDE